MITQNQIKEVLNYNPDNGIFTWLVSSAQRIKIGNIAGGLDKYGYIKIQLNCKTYKAHRLAFLYMTGEFPKNQVDHINHNRNDNRWENLRGVSKTENGQNRSKQSNNKSGFTGVSWHKSMGKWIVHIKANGKILHLGYFKNKDKAIKKRKEAEIKYGFHENHGRVL